MSHLFALLASAAASAVSTQEAAPRFEPAVFGLELPVRDVRAAERAYVQAFGFRARHSGGEMACLEKDGLTLVLVRSDAPGAPAGSAGVHLNLEARDLEVATERVLAAGLELP
jgi:hypothetical protein